MPQCRLQNGIGEVRDLVGYLCDRRQPANVTQINTHQFTPPKTREDRVHLELAVRRGKSRKRLVELVGRPYGSVLSLAVEPADIFGILQ